MTCQVFQVPVTDFVRPPSLPVLSNAPLTFVDPVLPELRDCFQGDLGETPEMGWSASAPFRAPCHLELKLETGDLTSKREMWNTLLKLFMANDFTVSTSYQLCHGFHGKRLHCLHFLPAVSRISWQTTSLSPLLTSCVTDFMADDFTVSTSYQLCHGFHGKRLHCLHFLPAVSRISWQTTSLSPLLTSCVTDFMADDFTGLHFLPAVSRISWQTTSLVFTSYQLCHGFHGRRLHWSSLLTSCVTDSNPHSWTMFVGWLLSVSQGRICLTSQQQASVSQGRICLDNFTCCHTEIEVADQTFCLTQSQYTDTGPTSPSADL